MRQTSFQKTDWDHRFSHGGNLRKKRKGRNERPLSTKEPIHLVLKINTQHARGRLRTHKRYRRIQQLLDRYSRRFFIRIEQNSIQFDHIHLLVRISRRSNFQNFLRVFAGQVAQRFINEALINFESPIEYGKQRIECRMATTSRRVTDTPPEAMISPQKSVKPRKTKLWKQRPYTRVIRGYRAYLIASDHVRLNELEATGVIPYREERLKGLRPEEWAKYWV